MSTQYRAKHLDSQVSGEFLLCFIHGSGLFSKVLIEALTSHGIKDIRLGKWYLQQRFLDTMRIIQKTIGVVLLRQVGLNIGANISTPPAIENVPSLLESLADFFAMHHKHIPEHAQVIIQAENTALVTFNSSYPPNLDYGILLGLTLRFSTDPQRVSVSETNLNGSTNKGGNSAQYIVKW